MKTEDISKNPPSYNEKGTKDNNPLRKPLQLLQHFFNPKKEEEAAPHKIVHTPHVNDHLLRPYLTKPAIDLFYMKVISVLEKQSQLSPIQARTTLTQAHIACTPEGEQLKATCHIQDRFTITFLFAKQQEAPLFSQLKSFSVKS